MRYPFKNSSVVQTFIVSGLINIPLEYWGKAKWDIPVVLSTHQIVIKPKGFSSDPYIKLSFLPPL